MSLFLQVPAHAATDCIYTDAAGNEVEAKYDWQVPPQYRSTARCGDSAERHYLANPDEIKLGGTTRKDFVSSPIGRADIRWQRKVESLFGRTPMRAVVDALTTVGRVTKMSGFPIELQSLALDWKIVFLDEEVPTEQIPTYLVNNCHPAWMTPPANIYVVAQRVVAGCEGGSGVSTSVADAKLSQVLIHEIGHALEHALLKGNWDGDRMRAEGFAAWFEQYASDFSAVNTKGAAREFYFRMAREAVQESPNVFAFRGSGPDYARASLFFHALVAKRGIRGVMDVYASMVKEKRGFIDAVQSTMGWSPEKLNEESMRVLN